VLSFASPVGQSNRRAWPPGRRDAGGAGRPDRRPDPLRAVTPVQAASATRPPSNPRP